MVSSSGKELLNFCSAIRINACALPQFKNRSGHGIASICFLFVSLLILDYRLVIMSMCLYMCEITIEDLTLPLRHMCLRIFSFTLFLCEFIHQRFCESNIYFNVLCLFVFWKLCRFYAEGFLDVFVLGEPPLGYTNWIRVRKLLVSKDFFYFLSYSFSFAIFLYFLVSYSLLTSCPSLFLILCFSQFASTFVFIPGYAHSCQTTFLLKVLFTLYTCRLVALNHLSFSRSFPFFLFQFLFLNLCLFLSRFLFLSMCHLFILFFVLSLFFIPPPPLSPHISPLFFQYLSPSHTIFTFPLQL